MAGSERHGQFQPGAAPSQGVSPNIAYSCYYHEFAGKGGTPTNRDLWGQQYTDCDTLISHVNEFQEAWWCQPILWGCVWRLQGKMITCDWYNVYPFENVWCPKDQSKATWPVNHLGDLWAVKFWYKTWTPDGTYAESNTFIKVQM